MSGTMVCKGGEGAFGVSIGFYECTDQDGHQLSQLRVGLGLVAGVVGYPNHYVDVPSKPNSFDVEALAYGIFGGKVSTRGETLGLQLEAAGIAAGVQGTYTHTFGLPAGKGGVRTGGNR